MSFWLNSDMFKLVITSFAAVIFLSGCGGVGKNPKPVRDNTWDPRLAGRIQKVDQASQFVLIRRYGGWHVTEGEVVESRGEGRAANLLPTGERLGEHVAADIRSGEVEEGDVVYIRKTMTPRKPENSGNPEN